MRLSTKGRYAVMAMADLAGNAESAGQPRPVPIMRAFAWYEEAMGLFKRAPLMWCLLGLLTLVSEFGLEFIPGIGVAGRTPENLYVVLVSILRIALGQQQGC